MSKRESFYLPGRELRVTTDASGSRSIVGTIPYNSPSEGLPWIETIAPGAFAGALEPGADCLLLRDHLPTLLLGRTLAGTLSLSDRTEGLQFRCTLPNTTAATDLIESLARKDISGVSFGFVTTEDVWADDGAGNLTRVLRAVELFEISVCSFAAFPDASVALRSIPRALRPLIKRSHESGCSCSCERCNDSDCGNCEGEDGDGECDDPGCASNGCPLQEDEDRSTRLTWSERTLLQIEIARRK